MAVKMKASCSIEGLEAGRDQRLAKPVRFLQPQLCPSAILANHEIDTMFEKFTVGHMDVILVLQHVQSVFLIAEAPLSVGKPTQRNAHGRNDQDKCAKRVSKTTGAN
jgi:hypothetical protein